MSRSSLSIETYQPITIGYKCSRCKNPIVSVIKAYIKLEKYYSFSQKSAENIIQKATEIAISREKQRINNCKISKISLAIAIYGNYNNIYEGSRGSTCLTDISTHCPFCNNIEYWQQDSAPVQDLCTESYPMCFNTLEEGTVWAQDLNITEYKKLTELRNDSTKVAVAKEKAIKAHFLLDDLDKQLENLDELKIHDSYLHTLKRLSKQQKALGFFDFKNKKLLKNKIKELSIKLADITDIIAVKKDNLGKAFAQNYSESNPSHLIAYGSTEKNISLLKDNSCAFVLETCDIPEEDIKQYCANNHLDYKTPHESSSKSANDTE